MNSTYNPSTPTISRTKATEIWQTTSADRIHSDRASLVPVSIQVSPQDYARLMARTQRDFARRQHQLVRLSLEKAGLSQQTRVMVLQQMRDLPPTPAVPAEPTQANP